MRQSRRTFVATASAMAGGITLLPYLAGAASQSSDEFKTDNGKISVHPVRHASFVMNTPAGTIYCDPVGSADAYKDFPKPDLILITHHHGDHYKEDVLNGIVTSDTQLLTNPTVYDKLSDGLKSKAGKLANGENKSVIDINIDAIPAYNLTEGRKKFHPQGRDNGYILTIGGFRIYISGDTEDIPEMRALRNINLAFVCMNLPFTMDAKAAASAVAEFKPDFVYPYHYRGRDGGTQDPNEFAKLVGDKAKVNLGKWYD